MCLLVIIHKRAVLEITALVLKKLMLLTVWKKYLVFRYV